ncbi:MAG: hypothetical protein MI794_04520 [Pseudomonadales bacterium]|nr:hypothetical protein [Pseudomonadales bacterium]
MEYASSLQGVLLRKIQKAEQDLLQLKLDYCRFVFGLTHRSEVRVGDQIFQVITVDVDSMVHQADGSYTRPTLSGIPKGEPAQTPPQPLGNQWTLVAAE